MEEIKVMAIPNVLPPIKIEDARKLLKDLNEGRDNNLLREKYEKLSKELTILRND